jgi:hypothetical protein
MFHGIQTQELTWNVHGFETTLLKLCLAPSCNFLVTAS